MNSRGKVMHRMVGLLLAVLMVVSMFAAVPFTASAEEGASANETVYLDFNAINSSVRRYGIHFDGFNNPHISAYTDYCTVEFSSRAIHEAGTYTVAETGGEYLYRRYHPSTTTVNFTDGSFTITLDEGFVTLSGTFTGDDGKTYVVTVTDSDRPIETIEINLDANNSSFVWNDSSISDLYWIQVSFDDDYYIELELLNNHVEPQTPGTYTYTSANEELGNSCIGEFQSDDLPVHFVAGSYTVTVDENLVTTVCGTLTGDDGKAYVLTLTNGSGGSNTPEEEYTLWLCNIGSVPEPSFWRSYFPERYSGDGNAMYNISVQMPYGLCITLPTANEITLNGYSFQGWYTQSQISSGDFSTSATTFDFTRDETLIARWTPNTYTVTVDPNGGYRNLYTSAGVPYRGSDPYTVSTVYGYWLPLFGNEGPIQRDGYRLVGFTGVNGGSTVGSFIDPAGNPSVFNDPNNYYYRIGPTDETLVAQWEKIPQDQISVTIGDHLTWSIENGVLTISGEGAMYDFASESGGGPGDEGTPWGWDYDRIVIEEGVTHIGSWAFYGSPATSVSIADSVTSIGNGAFAQSALTSVTIPANVTVWEEAFVMCADLTDAIVSPGVEKLDNMCFGGCENLSNVTLPDTLTEIGIGVFHMCHALSEIGIPDSVRKIGRYAFAETGLQRIVLPSALTVLEESTFEMSASLARVVIPEGVTQIENTVFYGCDALESLHIPRSVETILDPALGHGQCANFVYICCEDADGAAAQYAQENSIEFRVCEGHSYEEGDWTYKFTSSGVMITAYSGSSANVTIPSQLGGAAVTAISDYVFSGCTTVQQITMPDTVTSIGEFSFEFCENLRSIRLSENLTAIPAGAFGDDIALESITIPASVTDIGVGAFSDCTALESVTFSASSQLERIGATAFSRCTSLTEITLPDSLRVLGYPDRVVENMVFMNCTALESVYIPSGVTDIPCCTHYSYPDDPDYLEMIETGHAFADWPGTDIPWVFDGCDNLQVICSDSETGIAADFARELVQGGAAAEFRVISASQPQDQISVTIGDQIGVNLLLDLDARNAQNVTVVYKDLSGVEQRETFTDFSALPQVEGGLYKIAVQIAPAQIADSVTVYIDGETLDANVKEYCNTLIAGGYEPEVAALAQAVLDYGQAASNFFDYSDETLSNLNALSADDAKAWQTQFSDTTGKIQNVSFMALTKPEFRFYMKNITEAEAAGYTVRAAYADSTITGTLNARFVKNLSGSILIEVTGVMAEYMNKTITVTVDGLGTITFAGNDFAKMMANNAATETLGAALYAYGEAARLCFVNA